MQQSGKQQTVRSMHTDILNVAQAVRGVVSARGNSCTLGGVELQATAADLMEEAESRVAAFHRQVRSQGTAVFAGQAPVQLAKRLQIVDREELLRRYKPTRKSDEFDSEDDEPVADVSCALSCAASPAALPRWTTF